jgi:glycine/D-amino acid oxidase-like deaminating enzyme
MSHQDLDAIVIGAGAPGASITYYLSRLGQSVLLVDRAEPVTQTSPRAAGLLMQVVGSEAISRIGVRSRRTLVDFENLTGQRLGVCVNGSLKVARTEADVLVIEDEIRRGPALGVELGAIEPREAERLAPWVNLESALAISYTPSELYLEPGDLPRAYLRAAVELGAKVRAGATVTEIWSSSGVVEGVVIGDERIQAPTVIVTAGAWTRALGALAGVDIPLWPVRHQLCITEPVEAVEPHHATVRILDSKTYCRPESGGLMFGAYEPDPLDVDLSRRGADFDIGQLELDPAPLRRKMELVSEELPWLLSTSINELRGGLPTMTPDGMHILDSCSEPSGLWIVSGCNVGGLSTSPAIGEHMASWIVTGQRPPELEPFGLQRFGPEYRDEARVRQAGIASYSQKYGHRELLAPAEGTPSAGPG